MILVSFPVYACFKSPKYSQVVVLSLICYCNWKSYLNHLPYNDNLLNMNIVASKIHLLGHYSKINVWKSTLFHIDEWGKICLKRLFIRLHCFKNNDIYIRLWNTLTHLFCWTWGTIHSVTKEFRCILSTELNYLQRILIILHFLKYTDEYINFNFITLLRLTAKIYLL